ncbi:hypothetical protein LAZ67_2002892 [Cordylochernes scorpioides]|uniref:Uncharacterized protein n=1 Tax=Cordylochernes scorpioides TaxID=51811 RepID=A0ABY6K5T8_9ARAC|nr:hypothetical protein LAZ67_2002892 [Cordylochernes scorpioides]
MDQRKISYRPPNNEGVQRAREERLKELKMTVIVKEIFSYCFFLWILIVLSYGNRDPSAFYLRNNLRNAFIHGSVDFSKIGSTAQFWNWTRQVLIPEILVGKWYNGDQPFGLRGFLDDRVNRMMGYGVLRQIRVKARKYLFLEYRKMGYANLLGEDRDSYTPGWQPLNSSLDVRDEYHYRTSKELNGLPFWAQLDVYGGGGYVFPIRGTHESLEQEMHRLETTDWIDARSRAVFAEFSVYNAQVNLFGVLTIIAEFPPGGGLIPFYRIDAIRLMRYHQGFGLFVLLCELVYVFYTIYFTIREIKKFLQNRRSYFKSYWNWAEVMVVSLSYASIVIYIYRMLITRRILRTFERTHGNGYVKLQYVASVDEVFGYLMAFLIFISILKFTRLLRFNKRMGMLYSTLAQCSKDLKSFFVVFTITFLAFVQTFYLIFGISLQKFSSFVTAAETSFTMMQGDFDFQEFYLAAPILGPLLFFVYSLIMSIILLNVFIILIMSAFDSVKTDVSKQNNDYEIVDFLFKKIKGFMGLDSGAIAPDDILLEPTSNNTLQEFPEKVDKLLHYINSFYFSGKLDVDGKKVLKKMCSTDKETEVAPPKPLLGWEELDQSK